MTNELLIKALRCCIVDFNSTQSRLCNECPYGIYADGKKACENKAKRDAADALEAADEKIADCVAAIDALDDSNDAYIKENERLKKRIAELEDDLRNGTISNPERFKIYGYKVKDLILFAEMCKRNDVREADLKQAAWNLELAVRAVMNERQEIIHDTVNNIVSVRLTPDFEKAFAEMRGEHDEQIH